MAEERVERRGTRRGFAVGVATGAAITVAATQVLNPIRRLLQRFVPDRSISVRLPSEGLEALAKAAEVYFTDEYISRFFAESLGKTYVWPPNYGPEPAEFRNLNRPILEQVSRWLQSSGAKRVFSGKTALMGGSRPYGPDFKKIIVVDSQDKKYTVSARAWLFKDDSSQDSVTVDMFDWNNRLYYRLDYLPRNPGKPEASYSKGQVLPESSKLHQQHGTDFMVAAIGVPQSPQGLQLFVDVLRNGTVNNSITLEVVNRSVAGIPAIVR